MKQGSFGPIHQYLQSLPSWLYRVLTVFLIGAIGISIVLAVSGATTFLWAWGLANSFVLGLFSVSHARFLRRAESADVMARWASIVVVGVAVLVIVGLVTHRTRAMMVVYVGYFLVAIVLSLASRSKDASHIPSN